MPPRVRYSEQAAREAIAASKSYSEALRRLGMRAAGGNHRTLRKYAERIWKIPTDHFDPHATQRRLLRERVQRPLAEYLTEHSTYSRSALKRRLFSEGLKARRCEQCGVGEEWNGRPMALVLDHVNGVHDDNPLLISGGVCRQRSGGGRERRRHVVDGGQRCRLRVRQR